ncbi:MAG: VacJ family lipoprotein [Desulfobulbaceae bacterium]|nr:MAG: VacJ family lipoprotein [Desulfobulbaceae bacterium]
MSPSLFLKIALLTLVLFGGPMAGAGQAAADDLEALLDDDFDSTEQMIYDPLEPVNRAFFVFNDRLYFWLLKPVGKVYSAVLADEAVRGCISAAFHNMAAPVRVVNTLLQGKFRQSGTEVARFAINTVLGAGGLGDPAAAEFGLKKADEDLGQTLGFYGVGEGFYICWPLLGPSSARDSVGGAGDYFLNPRTYLLAGDFRTSAGLSALKTENAVSLNGHEYENLVRQAFDPYIAMRNVYYQHRRSLIAAAKGATDQYGAGDSHDQLVRRSCLDYNDVVSFDNLIRARRYQKCLEQKGGRVSVSRQRRQARLIYRVLLDHNAADLPHFAQVTNFEE